MRSRADQESVAKGANRDGHGRLRGLFLRPPIIPFLTAGFPSPSVFREAALAAFESGAGALEIGMPFSDPLADGPAIQHSSHEALRRGITLAKVLEMTARLRQSLPIPIFLMGYLNPMMRMTLDTFAKRAFAAGADGTIVPDCPLDEAGEWIGISRRRHLANVFLIAPTTPDERISRIDRLSTLFSYCVAVTGVTGVRAQVAADTQSYLRRVRRQTRKPFVVGFGISSPDHVRALLPYADGFAVGSALVPLLGRRPSERPAMAVGRMVAALARATS
ncbi:MAG: tryptophan synthase subunit alpha [candidate division Zixibacteria bacterium]|nr:tryptophan synthase subunit alpha [candidate division Zixibacteria bacterium]